MVAFVRFLLAAFFFELRLFFLAEAFFPAAAEISVTMDCGTFFILQVDLGIYIYT